VRSQIDHDGAEARFRQRSTLRLEHHVVGTRAVQEEHGGLRTTTIVGVAYDASRKADMLG
jgi:hypothetical protein